MLVAAPVGAQEQDRPLDISFPPLRDGASAGTGTLEPCLPELPGTVRCGRFRVLENRDQPNGRTIDLAFVVADALEAPKEGEARTSDAITFLFGGPGSKVLERPDEIIVDLADLRQHRDLLLLDLRGVGRSQALSCDLPYPSGVASRVRDLFPLDHVRACAEKLSRRVDLTQYTSAASMDDLDELRAFLNYTALDFFAGSYGTREAQIFLRRHPDSARAVFLDGVTPIFQKTYLSHARSLQDALESLVRECSSNARCAADYPHLAKEVATMLQVAKSDPPTIDADGQRVTLSVGAVGYALRGLLYRQGGEVPYFVHQAAQGNWQPLADYYLERQGWVAEPGGETGYHFSVICAESIAFITDQEVAEQTKGSFLGSFLVNAYREVCRVWPHSHLPDSFLEPVISSVPTLIFSGERDPVTPPSKGAALAALWPNSVHVVIPHGGHGTFSPCYLEMVKHLIETGSPQGIDRSCAAEPEPTEFRSP